MNREEQWLLPEGVEEILPEGAAVIEGLRRRLLDLYDRWGYQLVFPPLIEFLESLLNGAGRDLERETFKLTDQLSGRLMGVRADITPQVARIDAHSLRRNAPSRLCYCSTALRTRAALPGGSRIPYQVGVELFGHDGVDSDAEVIGLMLTTLAESGVADVTLDLGNVAIYRELVRAAGLNEADEASLSDIYLRKARTELDAFIASRDMPAPVASALAALPWLAGEGALARAAALLADTGAAVLAELAKLAALAERVADAFPAVQLHPDLGELRGYHYHTGCIFAAYRHGFSEPLAKGGRYDHIGEVFGRARPATGFSADLKLLAACQVPVTFRGILAPAGASGPLAAEITRLRASGERVVQALPGADNDPAELGCDRQLVADGPQWRIVSL
ncbi:ATP phosphoribosyltransferase regulatory subunit [Alcanivorax sp. JB21]|uniref:ATP phosphoribosyltransferase regulatory subunit n=1 Tax=Alcanivorax limicola TaxID=2874102 RepID=UPI001CBDEA40|nr:ATP phosphoribosyltransferase regulatory subunit [Alcanivorax limicola]MBZ2190234.1 ATP phosphoribosyltransferase regulatory subunit [Alcanivorax limicola]